MPSRNMEAFQRLMGKAEFDKDLTGGKAEDAMTAAFTEDYEILEPPSLPHGGHHRGRDEWVAMHHKMRALWDQKVVPVHIWDVPESDLIVLYSQMEWTAKETGKTATFPAVELLHFRDGLICKVEMFLQDTKVVLDTLEA